MKKYLLFIILLWSLWIILYSGFIFDDLYISCRYAYNLKYNSSLVFNVNEKVEGYTNFLWTIISIPFVDIPVDPSIPLKIISLIFAFLTIIISYKIIQLQYKNKYKEFIYILLLSTSPYFVIWSHPGMETSLFIFLGVLSLYFTLKNKLFLAFLSAIAASMTRPEGFIFIIAIILSKLLIEKKKSIKNIIKFSFIPILIFIIYQIWRINYYQMLFPNTFYVKLSGGYNRINALAEMIPVGLLIGFNFYFLFWGFINRKKNIFTLFSIIIFWFFLAYSIAGTPDFFTTFRLYSPAIPFILFAAVDKINFEKKKNKIIIYIISIVNILTILFFSFFFTQMKPSLDRSHRQVAEYIKENSTIGDTVLSQEMGLIPYLNPDLYFFDAVGLITKEVSLKLYQEGMNPYTMYYISLSTEGNERVENFKKEMRELFFKVNPKWIITVSYPSWSRGGEIENDPFSSANINTLINYSKNNVFFYDLLKDPKFFNKYKFVNIYPAYRIYFLLLFERID